MMYGVLFRYVFIIVTGVSQAYMRWTPIVEATVHTEAIVDDKLVQHTNSNRLQRCIHPDITDNLRWCNVERKCVHNADVIHFQEACFIFLVLLRLTL